MSTFEDLLETALQALARSQAAVSKADEDHRKAGEDLVRVSREQAVALMAIQEIARRILGFLDDNPPPPLPPTPAPLPSPTPTPVPSPLPIHSMTFPGEWAAETQAVIDEQAAVTGLDPLTIRAIPTWETGHFKDPNARAWREGNNPAGMLNTTFTTSLGAISRPGDGNKYAVFRTWYEGFRAFGQFLLQPLYAAARLTKDPLQQLTAIGAGGYADGSPSWLEGVQGLVRQWQKTTAPVIDPADFLTAHFRIKTDVCHLDRHPNNILPDSLRSNALAMAECLEKVREKRGNTPLVTNSWYRSPEVNAAQAGHSDTSKHLLALAVDLERSEENWTAIHAANVPGTTLQIENGAGGSHYHLELNTLSSDHMIVKWLTDTKESWE